MNKPDFLCIGAQKGGTTWLFEVLSENKEIWLGPFKETQYFNSLFVKEDLKWTPWHVRTGVQGAIRYHVNSSGDKLDTVYINYLTRIADEDVMFTEPWYRHIYSRGGRAKKGDISPAYCSIPPEGIDYVLRQFGPLPIIYMVRDPLSRAISQMRMNIDRNNIPLPSAKGEWERLVRDPEIRFRGDYKTDIANWLARYPNEQILFIPHKDIASDPAGVLRRVEQHIGVSTFPNYSKARNRVFEGKKIPLPSFVLEMMQDEVKSQYDFIKTVFDKEFIERL